MPLYTHLLLPSQDEQASRRGCARHSAKALMAIQLLLQCFIVAYKSNDTETNKNIFVVSSTATTFFFLAVDFYLPRRCYNPNETAGCTQMSIPGIPNTVAQTVLLCYILKGISPWTYGSPTITLLAFSLAHIMGTTEEDRNSLLRSSLYTLASTFSGGSSSSHHSGQDQGDYRLSGFSDKINDGDPENPSNSALTSDS